MRKIGLVLSGGGARGIGHVGVIKLLEELGLKISAISGTSAGAIIGAFYSAGYKSTEILEIAKSRKFFGFSNMHIGKAGIFDMKPFEEIYETYFPENRIERLPIPLYITATDIVSAKLEYFSEGELSNALMASSSVPLVFEPVKIEGKLYFDGGILNNFPVEPLLNVSDHIIGVHVNSISKHIDEIHMRDMLDRSFHMALSANLHEKAKLCNVFIEPPDMSKFGMFDFSKADEIVEYTYQHALTFKGSIEELMRT